MRERARWAFAPPPSLTPAARASSACAWARRFHLDPPATPERLRVSCPDAISAQFIKPDTRAKLSV